MIGKYLFLLVLLASTQIITCLNNGAAPTPPMGWSTWNTFGCNITEELVKESADVMAASGLMKAGYEYILIDDCWSSCLKHTDDGNCAVPAPRDSQNRLIPDANKFPSGMQSLANYVHSKGLKIGIYTASSSRTCAGYLGSLGYEQIDAQTFAGWGMDFVKMDTCNYDCGIHNGCIQNCTAAMRDGLNATGRKIVFYIDDGNDSSGPRVYNPYLRSYDPSVYTMVKIANTTDELIWNWGPNTANMWKSWFDIKDEWFSTIDNVHMQIGLAMTQSCGAYNTPDMLTIGQGQQSESEYRAQMFLWAVLGAPLILGHDIRQTDNFTMALVTAPEVLAIDQDPDCVQGSFAGSKSGGEIWVKPLHDNTFAVVLLNTRDTPQVIELKFTSEWRANGGHFYPAVVERAYVRDAFNQKDLGEFKHKFEHEIGGHDAMILKVTPINSTAI